MCLRLILNSKTQYYQEWFSQSSNNDHQYFKAQPPLSLDDMARCQPKWWRTQECNQESMSVIAHITSNKQMLHNVWWKMSATQRLSHHHIDAIADMMCWSGPWFNKMTSYQYRKSHCGDKTVVRSSYLHNGITYTGKMSYLYWTRAQIIGANQIYHL